MRSILSLPLFVLAAAISVPLTATPWQSPALAGLEYIEVQKPVLTIEGGGEEPSPSDPETTFGSLSGKLFSLLGASPVDYPSFVAAYVPKEQVGTIEADADAAGLLFTNGIDSWLQLPFHAFETHTGEDRVSKDFPASFASTPVPGFYLVQFAYPPKADWLAALESCGAKLLGTFQSRTYLYQAVGTGALLGCSVAPYLAWIDSYLTTDRLDPQLLAEESANGYLLQMRGDVDLSAKASSVETLAPSITVDDLIAQNDPPSRFLAVQASIADLANLAASDPDLLSVVPRGEAQWSDERQGQIVAGNVLANGQGLTGPGYRAWLECPPWSPVGNCKSLLAGTNHQLIGMIDSGFDDGSAPAAGVNHHPDLESLPTLPATNPEGVERLLEIKNFTNKPSDPEPSVSKDQLGHGTMVAGLIAGQGHPQISEQPYGPGSQIFFGGGRDSQGYFRGSGISPFSRLVVAQVSISAEALLDTSPGGRHERALQWMRFSGTADRASIVNESWNKVQLVGGRVLALPTYDQSAQFYDARVRDADILPANGLQPTAVVFSAGNQAFDKATGISRFDSVGTPGTAKNVITVGASESYRPAAEANAPGLDCRDDLPGASGPPRGRVGLGEDATHPARIGQFSGRGVRFQGKGSIPALPPPPLHRTRIKPDLVAPAVRVFSTIPYDMTGVYTDSPLSGVGCLAYSPPSGSGDFFTYGTGTSFAAPVVTGCIAHLRKWFLDRTPSTNPSPALIKAALVATSDNLGGQAGNDNRPSPNYGWGRVNLSRLLDSRISRFFVDRADRPVLNGQPPRVFERTITDPTKDVLIVLSWSDPPSGIVGNSQAALVNDLQLVVEELSAAGAPIGNWRGNNFQENVKGNDTGYSVRFPSAPDLPVTDSINTVEAVFIKANTVPAGRKLRITVSGTTLRQGPQVFALYALNLNPNS